MLMTLGEKIIVGRTVKGRKCRFERQSEMKQCCEDLHWHTECTTTVHPHAEGDKGLHDMSGKQITCKEQMC
jgi:hypothetical protein